MWFNGLFTRREGYPSMLVTLALTRFLFFSSACLQSSEGYPGRRLPHLRARVTFAGGFPLVNTPGKPAYPG